MDAHLIWSAATTLISATIGAFTGAYFRMRGEQEAIRAHFPELIRQEVEKTFATESVKSKIAEAAATSLETFRAQLQSDAASQLESYRDSLERRRVFHSFQRDLLTSHENAIVESFNEAMAAIELVQYRWSPEKIEEYKVDLPTRLTRIRLSASILHRLNALPEPARNDLHAGVSVVEMEWGRLLGELVLQDPSFRKEHPDEPAFSPQRFNTRYGALLEAARKLEAAVLEMSGSLLVPGWNDYEDQPSGRRTAKETQA